MFVRVVTFRKRKRVRILKVIDDVDDILLQFDPSRLSMLTSVA